MEEGDYHGGEVPAVGVLGGDLLRFEWATAGGAAGGDAEVAVEEPVAGVCCDGRWQGVEVKSTTCKMFLVWRKFEYLPQ